ncbi:MAG: phosphomethylpyrimidine synthase ThiC [Candidatus Omnitrophota bacterium]
MTGLEAARKKKITPAMRYVAKNEGIAVEVLRETIAKGEAVIVLNKLRKNTNPLGIGRGLRTKINANIGTSPECADLKQELKKLKISIACGADAVMDLSTGGDIAKIRRMILRNSSVPLGTVPIYEAAVNAARNGHIARMQADDMLAAIESQAKDGVDFMTIHCGVTQEVISRLKRQDRLVDVVSRGGSFLIEWMILNKKENPLYENFNKILDIAKKYDVVLSLGDGLRPGSIADSTDRPQIQELILLGELAERAQNKGVGIIIEGPGHVPLDEIEANVVLEKKLCRGAPFYVLGPLVTDVAPGYDHIVGAIGGAVAARHGADFLCYVTPSEHLRLPSVEDVKDGVIASKIAAHAADIAKKVAGASLRDRKLSKARKNRDWKLQKQLCVDPVKFARLRANLNGHDTCTMCSDYCSMKRIEKYLSCSKT